MSSCKKAGADGGCRRRFGEVAPSIVWGRVPKLLVCWQTLQKRLCFLVLLSEQDQALLKQQGQKAKTPLLAHLGVPWFESRQ